jgi:hypothetical protein
MLKKLIVINVLISIIGFIFIFYSYAGVSGGDIAIISANIFFGLLQILFISIFTKKNDNKMKSKIILTVIVVQIVELIIFIKWGYSINESIKHFKFSNL